MAHKTLLWTSILMLVSCLTLANSGPAVANSEARSKLQTSDPPNRPLNVAVVVHRATDGQAIGGLKPNNFAVFVDGIKREVTSFAPPESPVSVLLLVEFSKWTPGLSGGYKEASAPAGPGLFDLAAKLLAELIRTSDDQASVLAFDVRPVRLTDFTNDPRRLKEAINVLGSNRPGFRENCLFDSLIYALLGGPGDDVVLPDTHSSKADFSGLVRVSSQRKAVVLVASGWDTFSKAKYSQARRAAQDAGIPIYVIGTMGLFKASFGNPTGAGLEQSESQLKTLALETGGAYFPQASHGDVSGDFTKVSAMIRSQYNLAFAPDGLYDGKAHKIVVKVDIDGDGVYDDKSYVVQARQVYHATKN